MINLMGIDMPKISVLMPVCNVKEIHMREAIESILNQTYTDFEYLILNDSPENTFLDEIAASYDDKRIKYFKNEKNLGIAGTRNRLIDLSKGEYLAVMDHDDIAMPDRFFKQVQFLDENSDYGVVGTWAVMFPGEKTIKVLQNDEDIKIALVNDSSLIHPSVMIRKSILIDNNIKYEYGYMPAEDYMLWASLIEHTKFYNIPEALLRYRRHETNITKTKSAEMKKRREAIIFYITNKHPELYQKYASKVSKTLVIKLFGVIPFLKMITINKRISVKLFGIIPILSGKKSEKYNVS